MGFLTRVAERNRVGGLPVILSAISGTHHISVTTAHLPRIADYCRNYLDELLQLSGIEQRLSDGSKAWQIAGEWISKNSFIGTRKVKVCPLCLKEGAFIRGLWSLSFYIACARHGIYLTERCTGCDRPLKWDRRHVSVCGCGFDLTKASSSPASDTSLLLARILAQRSDPTIVVTSPRLEPVEIDRLVDLSIDALCKTIWFLGHCLAELGQYGAGHGRVRPTGDQAEHIIAQAFELLKAWPSTLATRLENIARSAPTSCPQARLERMMSPVEHYLHEELLGDDLNFIRVAYEHHIQSIWRTFGMRHRMKHCERQLSLDFE